MAAKPAGHALSIRARATLLAKLMQDPARRPAPPTLAVMLYTRRLQGYADEADALEALVQEVHNLGELCEAEGAVRLLLSLMNASGDVSATSRTISAATRRVADKLQQRPPANLFYPSAIVPRFPLIEGGQPVPVLQMCAHAEEQRRAMSAGFARADVALWARIDQGPPQQGGPLVPNRSKHAIGAQASAAASRRKAHAAFSFASDIAYRSAPMCSSASPTSMASGSVEASTSTAPGASDATARTTTSTRFVVPDLSLHALAGPPPEGLKPPPLVPSPPSPPVWPGYLTDAGDENETYMASSAARKNATNGSVRDQLLSYSSDAKFLEGSFYRWWHDSHWGSAEDREGAPRAVMLSEAAASSDALQALAGRPTASYTPLDRSLAKTAMQQAHSLTTSPECPSTPLTPDDASLEANARMCTPRLSQSTLHPVMSSVARAASRAAALSALADALVHDERTYGSVAMSFGRALQRVLQRQQEQLALLPDAIVLRVMLEEGTASCEHSCRTSDEEEPRIIGHERGMTLLAVLSHARRITLEQHALYCFCFRRLPAHSSRSSASEEGATSKMSQETALPSDGVQRAGSNITGRFDLPKGFPIGVELLNALYVELGQLSGVPGLSRAILWRLFTAASSPWLRWLRDAMFRAAASDPHLEFSSQRSSSQSVGEFDDSGMTPSGMRALDRTKLKLPDFAASLRVCVAESVGSLQLLQRSRKFEAEELGWPGSAAPVRPAYARGHHASTLHQSSGPDACCPCPLAGVSLIS